MGKGAAEQNFSVGLQRHRPHRGIRACSWIKSGVKGAIARQPRNAGAAEAIDTGKSAGDEELFIRLLCYGVHTGAVVQQRLKREVQGPVSLQLSQATSRNAVNAGKIASQGDLSRGIDCEGIDSPCHSAAGIEAAI